MLITERYANEIVGTLTCYDRVIIRGTADAWKFDGAMTKFFNVNNYRIFDFHNIFKPITEQIKVNIEKMANENNVPIEYVRKVGAFRKDDKIEKILQSRGNHEGLVYIFSQQELCNTYAPWHDKETHSTFFKPATTKRLVYYIYFIDKLLGLCYIKVPTVAPFGLSFYFNGHNLLETKLKKADISYIKQDNAFLQISDFAKAQELSDNIKVEDIHSALDAFAKRYCPLPAEWGIRYNWTISEVEYAMDIVFESADTLKPIYDNIIQTAMHTITPENIANFLGKRFSLQFDGESGSRYNKRILGTRIKHQLGDTSVKIYDKFGSVLRIEVTSNDVAEMRVFRDVHKRNGTTESKVAPVKKSIYSLYDLTFLFKRCANRYLETISAFDDPSDGMKKLDKAVEPVIDNNRKYSGFNFFSKDDKKVLFAVADPKFTIDGMSNKLLRKLLPEKSTSQISRLFKRLRLHSLIEKVRRTYKYRLTELGKQIITAGFKFINMSLVHELSLG